MAARLAARLASRRLLTAASQVHSPTCSSNVAHRHAATAAAPMTTNLHDDIRDSIYHQASLSNPDPTEDSATAAFLRDSAPYMVATYVRPMPMFVKGEGCYMYDMENRQYLDFTAGIAVNSLGHADPSISRVIATQADQLIHASNLYHNPWTPSLSKMLVAETQAQSPGSPLSQAFICNSGSEANEAAIKFARKVAYAKDPESSKREIVSFQGSFHGRTMGALSATPNVKYQKPFGPMIPGFKYGTFNDIEGLQNLVTEDTAGVIIEPIQGEGGINVATPEFLQALRRRCDETDTILIYDEIQCGLSRTGDLWAHTASGTHPDILTTAKALGNGMPIGATLISGTSVTPHIKTGDHGTTFGGNPLACRVAHHVFERLSKPKLQQQVLEKSDIYRQGFGRLSQKYPGVITEVRGRGLIIGAQLSDSSKAQASEIVTAARERGLLIITAGDGVLRVVPPLIISEAQIQQGLEIIDQAMSVVFRSSEGVAKTKGQQEMKGRCDP